MNVVAETNRHLIKCDKESHVDQATALQCTPEEVRNCEKLIFIPALSTNFHI